MTDKKLWNFENLPFEVRVKFNKILDRKLFRDIDVKKTTRELWFRENSFPLSKIKKSKDYEIVKPLIWEIKQNKGELWISIDSIQELTPALARVIARLIGDGSVNSYGRVEYGNLDEVLIDSFIEDMVSLFPKIKPHVKQWKNKNFYELLFNAICGSLLRFIFGEFGTYVARVPKQVMMADKKIKSAFLQAIFDDEGTVNEKAHQISFATVNKELAKDIMGMLKEFKIDSSLFELAPFYPSTKSTRTQYRINISNRKNIERFAVFVGFDRKCVKTKRLSALLMSYPVYNKHRLSLLKILNNETTLKATQLNKIIGAELHTTHRNLNLMNEENLVNKEVVNRNTILWSITKEGKNYFSSLQEYHAT